MVVDDCSTDSSLEKLKNRYGDSLTIHNASENKGQSYCRNLGARLCASDYICFLDSDDVLAPDAVEKRLSLLTETGNGDGAKADPVVSYGVFRHPGKSHQPLVRQKQRGDTLSLGEYLGYHGWCNNNGFLIEREVFLRSGMYDERLRNKEDIELLLRLLAAHPFYFCGTEIGAVRDVCGDRARNNYESIINQNALFSSIVKNNRQLVEIIGQRALRQLVAADIEEELRALYKLGNYSQYCVLYRKALKSNDIGRSGRFLKRYLLSSIKALI